jgi:hypothetical protein
MDLVAFGMLRVSGIGSGSGSVTIKIANFEVDNYWYIYKGQDLKSDYLTKTDPVLTGLGQDWLDQPYWELQ